MNTSFLSCYLLILAIFHHKTISFLTQPPIHRNFVLPLLSKSSLSFLFSPSNHRTTRNVIMRSEKERKKPKKSTLGTNSISSSSASISSPPSSTSSSISPTPAPRVTNKINVPIRQQIAWAKAYKRLISSLSSVTMEKKVKRFRKDKGEKSEDLVGLLDEEDMDYSQLRPPVVFIDGYNVIGFMQKEQTLKKGVRTDRGGSNYPSDSSNWSSSIDFDEARDCLISDLSVLKGATGWDIEVVFDAYKVSQSSKESVVVSEGVSVIYTSQSETADTYIERRFQELRESGVTNIVVVTDDSLLRSVTCASSGGSFLPVASLLEEMRIAYRGWENMEEEMTKVAIKQRPRLGDGLSDAMKQTIEELKSKGELR